MKLKELVLLMLLLGGIYTTVDAQERQRSLGINFKFNKNSQTENVDSIKRVTDSLHYELLYRDSICRANAILIDSLRRDAEEISLRLGREAKRQNDSLSLIIADQKKEIETFRANVGFVDTCMVKLANQWLYEPFNKADVDDAITYFDKIYSKRFKDTYSVVQTLLINYEPWYREFQTILKTAQADSDRRNPFEIDAYKAKYINLLKSMPYYANHYNNKLNIKYLKDQVTRALNIVQKHSGSNYADFSELIDPNFE